MTFANPWALLLLPFMYLWYRHHRNHAPERRSSIRFSDTGAISALQGGSSPWPAKAPFIARFLAVLFLVIALARPQTGVSERQIISKGIDIMLTLDLSTSMSASDFSPTRLHAAKKALSEFINGRVNDRIGLVVFAAKGYTQCPLTLDYPTLLGFLEESDIGLLEDGTAIGMALATAVSRLKDSKAKSRIAVLLTDGMNNSGAIDPATAAQMAKTMGVKVYTIGVGKEGVFQQTINDPMLGKRVIAVRTAIDEALLQRIAAITGGAYFRAEDAGTLVRIYKEIDSLEKTDIKSRVYIHKTDWFMWPLAAALALVLLELILPATPWRVAP